MSRGLPFSAESKETPSPFTGPLYTQKAPSAFSNMLFSVMREL